MPNPSGESGDAIATFTTSALTTGVHTLTANYGGDAQDLPSTASHGHRCAAGLYPHQYSDHRGQWSDQSLRNLYSDLYAQLSFFHREQLHRELRSHDSGGDDLLYRPCFREHCRGSYNHNQHRDSLLRRHHCPAGTFAQAGRRLVDGGRRLRPRPSTAHWLQKRPPRQTRILRCAFVAGSGRRPEFLQPGLPQLPHRVCGPYRITVTAMLGSDSHQTSIPVTVQ